MNDAPPTEPIWETKQEGVRTGARAGILVSLLIGTIFALLGAALEWSLDAVLTWFLFALFGGWSLGALVGPIVGKHHGEMAGAIVGAALGMIGGGLNHEYVGTVIEEIQSVWHQVLVASLIGLIWGALVGVTHKGFLVLLRRLLQSWLQINEAVKDE